MKFWPKVWGTGSSHSGEKQIPPLERLATPYASSADAGSRSDVRGEQREIRLEEERSRPYYEFSVPNKILEWDAEVGQLLATEDPADHGGQTVVAGSGVRFFLRGGRAQPAFSEKLTPGPGQSWPLRSPGVVNYSNPALDTFVIQADNFWRTWPSWQNNRGPEYHTWPGGDGRYLCTSTRAYGPGKTMAGWWMPSGIVGTFAYSHDVGKDVVPTLYQRGRHWPVEGAPDLPDEIDWRRGSVHSTGGRRFFVMSDTHGRFHVYPVRDYLREGIPFTNIPASLVKTYTPPYPAWVTMPDLGKSMSADMREGFFWSFNDDCTRIVGTPHREQNTMWYAENGPAWTAYEAVWFHHMEFIVPLVVLANGQDPSPFTEPPYHRGYWQTPGLVVLGLSIEVTGEGEMDFEAHFTLEDSSFYDTNGYRYFVDAGYLMRNRSLSDEEYLAQMGAPAGTLVTAEIELYWTPPLTDPRIGRNKLREVATGLPDYDIRASYVRSVEALGTRNLASAFYVVRRRDTNAIIRRIQLCRAFGNPSINFGAFFIACRGPLSQIVTADLRSLSWQFYSYHLGEGERLDIEPFQFSSHVFAWNLHRGTHTETGLSPEDAMDDVGMHAAPVGEAIPGSDIENADTAFYYLQQAALFLLQLESYLQVNVHPDGHWASCVACDADPTGSIDIIQAYSGRTALPRTSHREAFNAAFGQDRQPDHHDNFTPMSSAGIWRPA